MPSISGNTHLSSHQCHIPYRIQLHYPSVLQNDCWIEKFLCALALNDWYLGYVFFNDCYVPYTSFCSLLLLFGTFTNTSTQKMAYIRNSFGTFLDSPPSLQSKHYYFRQPDSFGFVPG